MVKGDIKKYGNPLLIELIIINEIIRGSSCIQNLKFNQDHRKKITWFWSLYTISSVSEYIWELIYNFENWVHDQWSSPILTMSSSFEIINHIVSFKKGWYVFDFLAYFHRLLKMTFWGINGWKQLGGKTANPLHWLEMSTF